MALRMLKINLGHGPLDVEEGISSIEKDDLNAALAHRADSLLIFGASAATQRVARGRIVAGCTKTPPAVPLPNEQTISSQPVGFGVFFDSFRTLC
ncbi:MAG: hypothetical protein LZF62_300148 [Nitrospira sp.]|nr:MAG: hypothetical protein LZF62_300148 [Nitrospira sp.]